MPLKGLSDHQVKQSMCQPIGKIGENQQLLEYTLIRGEIRIEREHLILQAAAKKFRSKSVHLS
jgi:hypothetical protein